MVAISNAIQGKCIQFNLVANGYLFGTISHSYLIQ